MATIRPIQALRPSADSVQQLVSVPYDVVNREEAAALAKDKPLSFLHVSRAEIDLDPELDPYDAQVYEKARQNFEKLQSQGHLVRDEAGAYYLYRLQMGDHVQFGIAATFSVDEYDNDIIKKHEKTRQAKEDDRTRHILTLGAQTGPVFLTYRPRPGINAWMERVAQQPPMFKLVAEDGVSHTLWRCLDGDELVKEFDALDCLYIADGHHRAKSASRAREEKAKLQSLAADDPANFFLAVAFPSDQVQILSYNRILYTLGERSPQEFLEAVSQRLKVAPEGKDVPEGRGSCCLYLEGVWYTVNLAQAVPEGAGPADSLDAAVLQREVFEAILGIEDIRTDPRVDFVGGIRGTAELVRLVDSGKAKAAFSMAPTGLDQLMDISDADEIMPPKSTWFEPKLRDGFVSHQIN